MTEHHPQQFATALSAKLATRSRHVCAFLGAGAGRSCGLPDVAELQVAVERTLDATQAEAFRNQLVGRNIEEVLSRLRRIASLITADQRIDDLTAQEAEELDTSICEAIVRAVDLQSADLAPVRDFAAWLKRADYRLPIELFTVNYDLLLETALESLGVPYFDGFVGTLRAQFRTELVEALPGADGELVPSLFVRLWKLHGSVNWQKGEDQRILRTGQPVSSDVAAAIYPSDAKYEESRRVPFLVLQDRFRRALNHPETLLMVTGYSFRDDHLNEMIFDAAARRERSEFVIFCFADIPAVLADRATRTPNLQVIARNEAILGGLRGEWTAPQDSLPNIWESEELGLSDFRNLAAYLARSNVGSALPLLGGVPTASDEEEPVESGGGEDA